MPVRNQLAALRKKRGLGAAEVAQQIGVSRQTIYAIEAGSYVPNTLVALRLAQSLEVGIEEIFQLEEEASSEANLQEAVTLPGDENSDGSLVQLCQVDEKLIAIHTSMEQWTLPNVDAMIQSAPDSAAQSDGIQVRSYREAGEYSRRLLIAGCDPAISIVQRYVQKEGFETVIVGRNSRQSLELLKQGLIHVAGVHHPELNREAHLAAIHQQFPGDAVVVFSYAVWEQGLVVARGNPKAIAGIRDLSRPDIRIVNREPGAGSRTLLDGFLADINLPVSRVRGYDQIVTGHLPPAQTVQSGAADCCLATRAAAHVFGLDFLPLIRERYDFVIRSRHLDLPAVQALIETLGRASLRRELQEFGGYDTSGSGERMG